MMIALVINLGYINKSATTIWRQPWGPRFGAFIDELGKFITGDNNYFYRPTVALIYIVIRLAVSAGLRLWSSAQVFGAGETDKRPGAGQEVVLEDLDHRGEEKALDLLKESSPPVPWSGLYVSCFMPLTPCPFPRRTYSPHQVSRPKILPEADEKGVVREGGDILL